MSGTVFALIAAALWLVIDPERLAELESRPVSVIRKAASA